MRAGKRVEQTGAAKGVLAGIRFLAHDPLLGPLLLAACLVNMLAQGLIVAHAVARVLPLRRERARPRLPLRRRSASVRWPARSSRNSSRRRPTCLKLAAFAMLAMPLPLWLLAIAMPWGAALVVVGAFAFFSPLVNAPIIGILTVRTPPRCDRR